VAGTMKNVLSFLPSNHFTSNFPSVNYLKMLLVVLYIFHLAESSLFP